MASYLEQYQQHLEDQLAKGGKPAAMEACLKEYNFAGDPMWNPGQLFKAWASGTTFTCIDCRTDYKIDNPVSTNETRCEKCKCAATTSPT